MLKYFYTMLLLAMPFPIFADFVEPPPFGNLYNIDIIGDSSGRNFCIMRKNDKAMYCIDGVDEKHNMKGSVNVGSLYISQKQILDGIGIYDKSGNRLIDLDTGKWVGDPTGLKGPKGDPGEKGDSCYLDFDDMRLVCSTTFISLNEFKGDIGPEGPQGKTGLEGPQGPKGPEGKKGSNGATGPRGPSGPKGQTGPRGLTGPRGSQGVQGPDGNVKVCARKQVDLQHQGRDVWFSVKATCSNGQILAGGGCSLPDSFAKYDKISSSYPSNGDEWKCTFHKTSSLRVKFSAYAVCCN